MENMTSIGPVSDPAPEVSIDVCWLLYIDIDHATGDFIIGKYKTDKFSSSTQGEAELFKLATAGAPSNWPDADGKITNRLDTLHFQFAGQFSVVLAKPNWSFYDYQAASHNPLEFLEGKTLYTPDGKPHRLPGSLNTSFKGSSVGTLSYDGKTYPVCRCINLCRDEKGRPLPAGSSLPLLFNLQIEVGTQGSSNRTLIVIDPGGTNLGPGK
jgi:hypothetical protein